MLDCMGMTERRGARGWNLQGKVVLFSRMKTSGEISSILRNRFELKSEAQEARSTSGYPQLEAYSFIRALESVGAKSKDF